MATRYLWLIAIVFFLVGVLVSIFTPFKIFLLFLPLVFVPSFFRRHKDDDQNNDPR